MQLFARALGLNRELEKLDRAEAVALGIIEAFNPEAQLLQELRQNLLHPEAAAPEKDPVQLNPTVMASLFGVPSLGE